MYDANGNLIADLDEGIRIDWTLYGKVRQVNTRSDSLIIVFRYDAGGNRIEKKVIEKKAADIITITRYVRDGSGNVMAIYNDTTVSEQSIMGAARLGTYRGGRFHGQQSLGEKQYELGNHLGNILVVITDNVRMEGNEVLATVVNTSDYYPFGLTMQARSWSDTAKYRYGFNGREKVDEIKGGEHYSFEFREYDPRTGRFNSIDPLTANYPWQSPYVFAANSPIMFVDIMGLGPGDPPKSTPEEANKRIEAASANIKQSEYFKNVTPEEFVAQLKERVNDSKGLNQGHGTNFCWAAACMSYVYEKDPAGMVDAMVSLYTTGTFSYANGGDGLSITPSQNVNDAVGSNTFDDDEGITNKEVDQMLFMALSDHFKAYMNIDDEYDPGDEGGNHSWAGGTLLKAKELWNSFGYDVRITGSDLMWANANKGGAVMKAMKSYDVVLFINSPLFMRNEWTKNWLGTHYIRLKEVTSADGKYNFSY